MKCPNCGVDNNKVIDLYERKKTQEMKRRRMCLECGYRFNTVERYYTHAECYKKDRRRKIET